MNDAGMENAAPLPDQTVPPTQRSVVSIVANWLRDLTVSVVLAVLVILFLYQPVKVEGTSMMPALVDQERIFINKFVYRFGFGGVERGDMVVFWFPGDPTKSYIKRIIGLPGETVEVRDGNVLIDGRQLEEGYVTDEYRDRQTISPELVGREEFYVMGDHRSSSNDSRSWGTVHRKYIYGKAVFVYWPIEKVGILR